jgi:hypothetical protein
MVTKLSALALAGAPNLLDLLEGTDISDLTDGAGGSSRGYPLYNVLGLLNATCQGRLTLTSNLPVTVADVTGATNIYFTPHKGNKVALHDGTTPRLYAFTELALALGTLTNGLPYDTFLYDNAGTLTLEKLAWASTSARATAITLVDGIPYRTGALTHRLLGTFMATSTTTTEDSATKRFLANLYNAAPRPMMACPGYVNGDDYTSYNHSGTTFSELNGGVGSKLEFLVPLDGGFASADMTLLGDFVGTVTNIVAGIGIDSITGPKKAIFGGGVGAGAGGSVRVCAPCAVKEVLAAGYHYFSMLALASGSGSATIWADIPRTGAAADPRATSMDAWVLG